jgi:hypothetical protein
MLFPLTIAGTRQSTVSAGWDLVYLAARGTVRVVTDVRTGTAVTVRSNLRYLNGYCVGIQEVVRCQEALCHYSAC